MADDVIVKFRADISDLQKELGTLKQNLSSFDSNFKNIGNQLVAAFSTAAIINLGKNIVDITARFQKMEAVLINTLGSRSEAQKAFKQIADFALKTNFTVEEVTSSFIKLANQGFKPTIKELNKLADVANSTGKTFDQLTEAIIDAQTGEFERLKEFGIIARKEGDKVKFSFKEVTTEVNFTNKSIRDYILSLGELQGVSGATEAVSKTLGAQISFLGDSFDKLLVSIGELGSRQGTGLISGLADVLGTFADKFTIIRKRIDKEVNILGQTFSIQNYGEVLDEADERNNDLVRFEQQRIDKIRKLKRDDKEFNEASNKSILQTQQEFLKSERNQMAANFKELERLRSLEFFSTDFSKQRTVSTDKDIEKTIQEIAKNQAVIDFLEKEYPNAVNSYVKANNKIVEKPILPKPDILTAYQKLLKDVTNAQEKIKDNSAKGIFDENAIKNLTKAEEKLRLANKEIERQTLFFEKQKTIAETSKIPILGAQNLSEKQAENQQLPIRSDILDINTNKATREDVFQGAQDLANGLLSIDQQLRDQRIQGIQDAANEEQAILDRQLRTKQISEEKYQIELQKLNKKTNDAIRAERLKQFNIDKAYALTQIAINGAQAVSKALALTGTLAPAVIALTTATVATQLALVASQAPPKFEKGGLIKGRRHKQGGVLIEAEGGEYVSSIPVTNKYFSELEAMKHKRYEQLITMKYITPALRKQESIFKASLNDENLIQSDRATRTVLREIKDVLKQNNITNNLRFKNV